jgi:hypothetical protein
VARLVLIGGVGLVCLALDAAPGVAQTSMSEAPQVFPPDEALTRTLSSPRYRFCADPTYPLAPDEATWCKDLPLSPDPRSLRCPTLARACQAGATAQRLPELKPIHFSWLPSLHGLGQPLLWLLAAGALAALVAMLVRFGLGDQARRRPTRDDRKRAPGPDRSEAAAVAAEVERDVERLLARARAAATAGDFAAAVPDLYAALLRRLEGDGHLRIHRSATNGDYLRELQGKAPALVTVVRAVATDVEATQFGTAAPDQAVYQSMLARIAPLLSRAGLVMIGLLVLALGGGACRPAPRPDWAASPSGTAAVAQFLTSAGLSTTTRLHSVTTLHDPKHGAPSQIVLLPGAELGEAEWTALHDWLIHEESTLVLATGPGVALPPWLASLVEPVATGASGSVRSTLPLVHSARSGAVMSGQLPGATWLRQGTPPGLVLVERGQHAYATEVFLGESLVVALADARLFTNQALVMADNADLLLALLLPGGGPVELVGEETGVVSPTPVASVARGRLAPFMAQLVAFLVLFLLMQGRAFGRLVERNVVQRRVFAEHVRAVGLQYARARAAAHALSAYAAWVLERLRERLPSGNTPGVGDLAASVSARTGRPLGEVARLLFSAHRRDDGSEGASGTTPPDDRSRRAAAADLAVMRDLHALLAETGARARPAESRPSPLASSPSSPPSSSSADPSPTGSPKP